jgi:predicted aldo/keto reductase-like oxidoreductase
MEMLTDNINTFSPFVPLSEKELKATDCARDIIREVRQIPCTKCDYCAEVCPKNIPISEIFSVYNKYLSAKITRKEAKENMPKDKSTAGECIKCGACENICPQGITIKQNLEKISKL